MKYLLDTNTCIRHLNQRSKDITRKLASVSPDAIAVCSVVKAEMFAGARKSNTPEITSAKQRKFLDQFTSLPFDDTAADLYATIRAALERAGTPIGPLDMLIAAIALANNLILYGILLINYCFNALVCDSLKLKRKVFSRIPY